MTKEAQDAAARERKAVVDWLRRWANLVESQPATQGPLGPMLDAVNAALVKTARRQCSAIERGDHKGDK